MSTPFSNTQNPSPNPESEGQESATRKQELVDSIMGTFRKILPSNYVALTNGPYYSLQFQAMAEQLAAIQLSSTEVYKDSDWDFTRPDFLWQVLGSLVFPGSDSSTGIPQIDGDRQYREFLKKMVLNLLKGSTKESLIGGLESISKDAVATIIERYLDTPPRNPDGGYTIDDQFIIDIFLESSSGGFPTDPFTFQENAKLVIEALKPAHVLYGFSFLFRDAFGTLMSDDGGLVLDLDSYYYEDMRKWCYGAERIASTGEFLSTKRLFSDPTVSFESIRSGAKLTISSGVNKGSYTVSETLYLLSGVDSIPRAYTLSSGGSGSLTVLDDKTLYDATRDWGLLPRDERITISSGPNAGTYRLDRVTGSTGGYVGDSGVSGNYVRISPSILKIKERAASALSGQEYEVVVDRLGVQVPHIVSGEDVSSQFLL